MRFLVASAASIVAVVTACALTLTTRTAQAHHSDGVGASFTFLQAPFTQDLYATHLDFGEGVAFAPDGDPLVAFVTMRRIDADGDEPTAHGDELHPVTVLDATACVGLANHSDGTLYANELSGITSRDAETGAVLRGPFGAAGNCLGIAVDPQTGNVVYADALGTVSAVDAAFTTTNVFSAVAGSYDGMSFDPTGDYLFLANFAIGGVTVLARDGSLVQHVPYAAQCCADGLAFHPGAPPFVVSSNTDGTMTRLDFPDGDFTQPPTQMLFASGGFRGDLANVGADGCMYLSQGGTRFEDGAETEEGSLVRICPGFAPPPGSATPVATATPTPIVTPTAGATAAPAETKDDCKEGGWRRFGFRNQGACIASVRAGRHRP